MAKIVPVASTTPSQPPAISLRKTPSATEREILRHLLALEVIFPCQHLDRDQTKLKYRIFFEDLRGLSEPAIAQACRQYRLNPENRFFPTPGQLLGVAPDPDEAERERALWLTEYGIDARWPANTSGNGVWTDLHGVGPPPHDHRTLVSESLLDHFPKARAMRDKLGATRP